MTQHIVTPIRLDGTSGARIRVIGARDGIDAIKLAELGTALQLRHCRCEAAKYEWRVWLFGEELPRIVVTESEEPMYAVATAMNAAKANPRETLKAERVELLGVGGVVVRSWAY